MKKVKYVVVMESVISVQLLQIHHHVLVKLVGQMKMVRRIVHVQPKIHNAGMLTQVKFVLEEV